ncbi:hypothetical protein BH11PSE5_BH11PSE5_10450 [soil metagenome]|uniref:hypothetical protein n=1 Tax=unclassified Sphingobium TaxID=2611147 RepID=UPI001E5BA385|nr:MULTISPECIES: hypothetical protein [unclassified Sphingobium]CAH0350123.1 hypothetical protein SPH9361_00951 [Sphingobium sp. CECT 9361]|tara:strand:- start:925 stop:1266 length:342 start_codon:yes stop_codon:yes gene_type:complete
MTLEEVSTVWGNWKHDIEIAVGLSPDAMHIHVGVLILLSIALVTRKRMDHWAPWLGLFVIECCNEFIDLNQVQGSVENNWPASQHDILNTMFLPTMIMLYARIKRFEKVGSWG